MKLDDGRELLLTFAMPLPLGLMPELLRAVADAAARAGYTDVVLRGDGTMQVIARPPAERTFDVRGQATR